MVNFQLPLRASILLITVFAFSSIVQAQATRTWVSGVGDDINPCSRTAPCKTFAGAISKTAKGGEINPLDAGGFGTVTITKSITIDGTGVMASALGSLTNGIVINITESTDAMRSVRIRGLSIIGAGSGLQGIKVVAANNVSIENVVIDGYTDGISVTAPAQVFVKNTSIRNNSGTGVYAAGGSQVAMSDVSVVFNGTGLDTASGGTIISFRNNVIYGNKRDGSPTTSVALR